MEYIVDFLPKVKIEVVLDDDQVDEAIEAIIDAAKTDKIGDGKIFVSSIEQAIEYEPVKADLKLYNPMKREEKS